MKNLIYGITAFLGIVALVLLCYATYLLCIHCQQNKKVVIGGVEYYASPPSIAGSETSRDLIALRESDVSAKNRAGGKVLQQHIGRSVVDEELHDEEKPFPTPLKGKPAALRGLNQIDMHTIS